MYASEAMDWALDWRIAAAAKNRGELIGYPQGSMGWLLVIATDCYSYISGS